MTAYLPCDHIHGERWRSIDGYAKEYQVSQLGRVRYRMKGGKWYLFHPRMKKNGKYIVNLLRSDGTKQEVQVRTLVMRALSGNVLRAWWQSISTVSIQTAQSTI